MKAKDAAISSVLCGILHAPISFVTVLCLGRHADWYLIPMYPFEVLISSQRYLVAWVFLAVGALRYSSMLFFVLTAQNRIRVVLILALLQIGAVVLALMTR